MEINWKIFNEVSSQQQKFKEIISKAIDDKAWEQGYITSENICDIMIGYEEKFL